MNVKRGAAVVMFAFLLVVAWPDPGTMGQETRSSRSDGIDLNCNPAQSDACAKARLKEARARVGSTERADAEVPALPVPERD